MIGARQKTLLTGKPQSPTAIQRQVTVRATVDEYALARRRWDDEVGTAARSHVRRSAVLNGLGTNTLRDPICDHASMSYRVSLAGVTEVQE